MQHDLRPCAAARAVHDDVYPPADMAPFTLDEAERLRTVDYRQAVGAAQDAKSVLNARAEQLLFAAIL